MTPEEQKTLDLLLKKREEEERVAAGGAPVLQLVPGGGEKNAVADRLAEFSAMARRGEVFDYAIVVIMNPGHQAKLAWGSAPVPTLQICGAVGALQQQLLALLVRS